MMSGRFAPPYRDAHPQHRRNGRPDSHRDLPRYYDQSARRRRSRSPQYERRVGDRYDDRPRDNGYVFRGAADRDQYRRPEPRETFSYRAPGPVFPPSELQPSPRRYEPRRAADQNYGRDRREPNGRRPDGSRGGRGGARFRQSRKAHARDILSKVHGGSTPELLHGMNAGGEAHFLTEYLSSDEEGDSEDANLTQNQDDEEEDGNQTRSKRVKIEPSVERAFPKWSNPDPYTSLPPPESLGAPKKDIVQVIRKAKLDSASKDDSNNAVKDNVDFISFNFDAGSEDGQISDGDSGSDNMPPRNAPTGPATMRPPPLNSTNTSNGFTAINQQPSSRTVSETIGSPPPPPPEDLEIPTDAEIAAHLASLANANGKNGKKRKREQQSKGVGGILPEWESKNSNPTPWCIVDHSRTPHDALRRLHMEICDFFEYVRPHGYEETAREDLIARVRRAVRGLPGPESKGVEVKCFGSFYAGLYLPTADMDLVAVSPNYMRNGIRTYCQSNSKLHKLARHLENTSVAATGSVSPVTRAKVPIVKFTDKQTGLRVDISFENDTGLVANDTFQDWKESYPAMPTLVVLIKQMLAMRGLNEVFTGGLGGFSIICLVVHMMQMMPQSDNMDRPVEYGDLLLQFLDFYGNRFDITRTGIIMNPPAYYDKVKHPMPKQNAENLTIIDPNNPYNDISGGSRCINEVLGVFRIAHHAIEQRLAEVRSGKNVEGSLLGCVFGGDYSSFLEQRNRLSMVNRGRPATPPPPALPQPAMPHRPKQQQPPPPPPPPPPPSTKPKGLSAGKQSKKARRKAKLGKGKTKPGN